MAPVQTIDNKGKKATAVLPDANNEDTLRPVYYRLAALNGALIGLSISLGVWGREIFTLRNLPVSPKYGSILVASLLLIGLGGLTGWLTARLARTLATVLLWLVTAVLAAFIISFQPYQIRTAVIWLTNFKFWGLNAYPFVDLSLLSLIGIVVAGFFIVLILILLAVFQDYRLANLQVEMGNGRWPTGPVWKSLLLPLPLVILAAFLTSQIMGAGSWQAIPLVYKAIEVSRAYDGDLFELGRHEGVNYNALKGVRDLLGPDYSLTLSEIDPVSLTTNVAAIFADGGWINCRVVNEQLSFCYDASPPYTSGLAGLLAGETEPEECRDCFPNPEPEAQTWLDAHRGTFGDDPQISRQAQFGSYVIMTITSADGSQAAECLFQGVSNVRLLRCQSRP